MREREQSRKSDVQSRQLTLLKEIDAMSSSGGSTGAQQGGAVSRHLPIGSVVLRPELRRFGTSWAVRLRLTVPSRSVAYVVKDVAAFSMRCDTRSSGPTVANSRSCTPAIP